MPPAKGQLLSLPCVSGGVLGPKVIGINRDIKIGHRDEF